MIKMINFSLNICKWLVPSDIQKNKRSYNLSVDCINAVFMLFFLTISASVCLSISVLWACSWNESTDWLIDCWFITLFSQAKTVYSSTDCLSTTSTTVLTSATKKKTLHVLFTRNLVHRSEMCRRPNCLRLIPRPSIPRPRLRHSSIYLRRDRDRDPSFRDRGQDRDVHSSRDQARDLCLRWHLAEFALLKVHSRILLLLYNFTHNNMLWCVDLVFLANSFHLYY